MKGDEKRIAGKKIVSVTLSAKALQLLPLCSAVAAAALYAAIFHLLDIYDWDQAFTRFSCLLALVIFAAVCRANNKIKIPAFTYRIELGLAIACIVYCLASGADTGGTSLMDLPHTEIGLRTEDAARIFFINHANPYSVPMDVRPDLPGYAGFKYGPVMFIGYGISVITPLHSVKIMNAIFLAISVVCACLLAMSTLEHRSTLQRWTTGCFCAALFLIPYRLWYEIFPQGGTDILPVMLILLSLLAMSKNNWFTTGLFAALSFSSKFSPGILWLLLLLTSVRNKRMLMGMAVGVLPVLPFMICDGTDFVRNFFLYHMVRGWFSTSLYSITPLGLHFLFPIFQLLSLAIVLWRNHLEKNLSGHIFWLLVLILMTGMFYKGIQGNYLIWIIPFAAIHIGRHRHRFLSGGFNTLFPAPPFSGS